MIWLLMRDGFPYVGFEHEWEANEWRRRKASQKGNDCTWYVVPIKMASYNQDGDLY